MKLTIELPDFVEKIVLTGTAFSDAEHRQSFSAAFRAEDETVIGFNEKRIKVKNKKGEIHEARKMSPFQYKKDPEPKLGEWFTLLDEPKKGRPYLVTLMPEDVTRYDRIVRESKYDGVKWSVPDGWRVVAWRNMPDAFEGGYVLDDDGAKLLVEAILYQIQDDYLASAKRIAECKEKIAEYDERKAKNAYYRDQITKTREKMRIEASKMKDCERAILNGWPGMVGGPDYADALIDKIKRAAEEYVQTE